MAISAAIEAEIRRKALNNEKLDIVTPEKQALYNKYVSQKAASEKGTTASINSAGTTRLSNTTGADLGNNGIGSQAQMIEDGRRYKSDIGYAEQRLNEANTILSNRRNQGLDTSAQEAYIRKLNDAIGNLRSQGQMTSADQFNNILGNLGQARDAQIAASTAQVQAAADAQINAIKKALNDAVMNGELSIQEANAAYADQQKQIQQQAYLNSQMTNLAGQDRGIANSQQFVGLMQGDQARNNSLMNQNATERDQRIADVKTRLRSIQNASDLDIANANAQAGYQIAGLTNQAYADFNSQMFQAQLQQFLTGQGMQHDRNMAQLGQSYNLQNMGLQQQYNQQNMAQQQQYARENMAADFANQLEAMRIGQGYDMEKMKLGFSQDLQKMARQNSYEMGQISARQSAALKEAETAFATQLAQEETEYKIARDRELAKYTPGTPEYNIRKQQMDEAHSQAVGELYQKTMFDATSKMILEDPSLKKNNYQAPVRPANFDKLSQAQKNAYNAEVEAYLRYKQYVEGSSDPTNLMQVSPSTYSGFNPPVAPPKKNWWEQLQNYAVNQLNRYPWE